MTTNTGGPAFPQNTKIVLPAGQEIHQGFMGGMTLRDYFAAKALNGLLAGTLTPDCIWSQDEVAETAYNMADAMLKAREA